jgi:predicted protein tyrosine phosphatase
MVLAMNILFLCTSNLHRSRTAEDYFKSVEKNHVFQSAGLSEKYCAKYGTQLCSVEMLKWADKIFVMESLHANRIRQYAGEHYLAKVEILHISDIYKYMQPELLDEFKSNAHLQFMSL